MIISEKQICQLIEIAKLLIENPNFCYEKKIFADTLLMEIQNQNKPSDELKEING